MEQIVEAEVNTGTTAPISEFVSVEEASDADIKAFLADTKIEEQPEETEEIKPQPIKPQAPTETPPVEQVPTSEPEIKQSQEDLEKMRRQIEVQERMIQRQANELGELRKKVKAENEEILQRANELAAENPAQAFTLFNQAQRSNEQLDQHERSLSEAQQELQTKKLFYHYVDPKEISFDEMGKCLEADGIDSDTVSKFKSDPFKMMSPDALIHLAHRTKDRKAAYTLATFAKGLMDENKELKAKLHSKPQEVVSKIIAATSQPPPMSAATGGGPGAETEDSLSGDPTEWTDDEIKAFLKKTKR